jgi:hypothetical protein
LDSATTNEDAQVLREAWGAGDERVKLVKFSNWMGSSSLEEAVNTSLLKHLLKGQISVISSC